MMDNFKEDIVSPRSNALGNVLYALCWVFIVLFGAYALMMLQVVMVQFSVLTLVTVAMAAACAVRHPLALSGGERQRLAVAAGLAQGARVLVLDEPTSGLDRANMERVAAVLRRAAADGVAVVLVTHDYEFLCAVCDEAAEVEGGRIQARYPLDDAGLARVRARFGL